MKKINGFATATTLLCLTLGAANSQAASEDLPTLFDEDTLLYIEIPSIPQLQADWEDSPFYELYEREDVKDFVDAFIDDFKSEFTSEGGDDEFDEEDQELLD